MSLYKLWQPRPGRARQASSYGRDRRGGDMLGIRPAAARRKRVLLAPGETHTLLETGGAGIVERLWLTVAPAGLAGALDDLVLSCTWDGETSPSVEVPLGAFFGAAFGRARRWISEPLAIAGGGLVCRFPMPYANGARIAISNTGARTVDPLFYAVGYRELGEPLGELRFHAQWRRENPTTAGLPFTLLEAEGRGHFVGCQLWMQNREWWLRPPLAAIVFPRGFGLGMLEGVERIWIDGEAQPSIIGTGTEDYFNAGWYFWRGRFATSQHGCLRRDVWSCRVAAYRFDVAAPLPFASSLRVAFDHGIDSCINADYTGVAYWYQSEPHRPFPALPPAAARRPRPALDNRLQGALLALPLLARALLALGRARR